MEKSTIVRSHKSSPLLPLVRTGHRALSALTPALAARRAERLFDDTAARATARGGDRASRDRPRAADARRRASRRNLDLGGRAERAPRARMGRPRCPARAPRRPARRFWVFGRDVRRARPRSVGCGHGHDPGDHERDPRGGRVAARAARRDRRSFGRRDRRGAGALGGRSGQAPWFSVGPAADLVTPALRFQRDLRVFA